MANESAPFPTSAERLPPDAPDLMRAPVYAAPGNSARAEGSALDDATRGTAAHADDLIGRIAQSAHQTIDRLAESASPHVSRLQENLSGEALHQRADQVRDLSGEWTESLRCTVRENPLAALGVAVAVGLLVARLTR